MFLLTRRRLGALALSPFAGTLRATTGIDEALKSGIVSRKIPAVSAMAATATKTLYRGAFGTRDSSGVPVTPDTIFSIASMTKAITTAAALQLVERGKVDLNAPASKYLPQLASLDVLQGFDAAGKPILRPARTQVTLKHLLTHTSGFCYDTWDGDMFRYVTAMKGQPAYAKPGPLMFEPGKRWQYGQGIDWAGRIVEAVSGKSLEDYFQAEILGPLTMQDTSYILPPSKFDRYVTRYNRAAPDAPLQQAERKQPPAPKEFNGGGGLYSTTADYTKFMQMILNHGQTPGGPRILKPETVALMQTNQIGNLSAGKMKSHYPEVSSDVDIQPGAAEHWTLGFLINPTPYQGGRSAGSLAWAGLYNTFYWIDPKRSLCAVIMMQFLPFVDKEAVGMLNGFEHAVYAEAK